MPLSSLPLPSSTTTAFNLFTPAAVAAHSRCQTDHWPLQEDREGGYTSSTSHSQTLYLHDEHAALLSPTGSGTPTQDTPFLPTNNAPTTRPLSSNNVVSSLLNPTSPISLGTPTERKMCISRVASRRVTYPSIAILLHSLRGSMALYRLATDATEDSIVFPPNRSNHLNCGSAVSSSGGSIVSISSDSIPLGLQPAMRTGSVRLRPRNRPEGTPR
jgi:hypothetical protein